MDQARKVIVFDTEAALVSFVMKIWRRTALTAVAQRGSMRAAISGGKTPLGFYRAMGEHARDLPWDRTTLFLVDERFVPHTDAQSNFGMIRKVLLEALPLARENVHAVETQGLTGEEAAERYERELIRVFSLKPHELPRFDLIMLGMGQDGHVASLFPGSALLSETRRLVGYADRENGLTGRVTLTMPVLNGARSVIFLIEGLDKAETLKKVIEERDASLPATRVRAVDGDVLFAVDKEAADKLTPNAYVKGAP